MTERWLPVPDFEGIYSVSDQGRVRSETRVLTRADGVIRTWSERMMRTTPDGEGYPVVTLQDRSSGRYRKVRVHTLVAEVFIGPRPAGQEVLHWDGDRMNVWLTNLRYGTHAENGQDTTRYSTECRNGHQRTLESTYIRRDGTRQCLICMDDRNDARPRRTSRRRSPRQRAYVRT